MKKKISLVISIACIMSICLAFSGCMDKETRAAVDAFDQETDRITQQISDLDKLIAEAESDLSSG